jgi:streptogramin lyase
MTTIFRSLTCVGLTLFGAGTLALPAHADSFLSGKIVAKSGEPLGGVLVSAKGESSTITTSVYTDAQGSYVFPPMAGGSYKVWAQAIKFGTAHAQVALSANKKQDFELATLTSDLGRQLPGDMMLSALPESTPDEARMKNLVSKNCTGCHSASFPLQHKFDQEGWEKILTHMGRISLVMVYNEKRHNGTIDSHLKELAAYLAKARGPGESSMNFDKLRPRPSGEAARVVIREYDVPVDTSEPYPYKFHPVDGSDWSLGTPSKTMGHVGVHDAQQDFDGNIWFTHSDPSKTVTVGRIDAKTGAYKAFKVNEPGGYAAQAHGMTRDLKGNIWFNTRPAVGGGKGNRPGLGKIDPKTEKLTVYVPGEPMSPTSGTLDVDGKGFVWVTSPDGALRFDPDREEFQEFKSVNYKTPTGTVTVYGLAGDKDGNGWWLGMNQDLVNRADNASGKVTETQLARDEKQYALTTDAEKAFYKTFSPPDFNTPLPWAQGARRMGADKAANVVYVGDGFGGNYARIDIKSGDTSFIPTPDPAALQPYAVAVDSKHNVWTNFWSTDAIGEYDPSSKTWTVFDLPTRGTESRYLSVLERPEGMQVVVPYYRTRKVALMSFRSEAEIAAEKSRAQ